MRVELNTQFVRALEVLENTRNPLFITGRAGTGKSTLLSLFRHKTKKKLVVLAPTGVAALNVRGETIHSFFGFAPGLTVEDARREAQMCRERSIFDVIDAVVLDEISMVRADLMDCMDEFLRIVRRDARPFGGVQMVLIGDLHQLPPVVTSDEREYFSSVYRSPYFFDAHVFENDEFGFAFVELQKIYRQKDRGFIDILNAVRQNQLTLRHLEELNQRVLTETRETLPKGVIHLTTTNARADEINATHLRGLKGRCKTMEGVVAGEFDARRLPTEEALKLKAGAQIMMLNNDAEGRWVNGTIGRILSLGKDGVKVELPEGKMETVEKHTWNMHRYQFDVEAGSLTQKSIGSFTQYPMRLAWAVTIHKSQGKTFDDVVVDLGWGSFAHGQTYVALSRCRTLEGLRLMRPLRRSDIISDQRIRVFLEKFAQ